jgi:acyl carrier protein
VDDVADNHCSYGLHFCSQSYLQKFGGDRIVILKINPRDVVSIPTDYNHAKGRCCRYEVIGELAGDPSTAFVAPVQESAVGTTISRARITPVGVNGTILRSVCEVVSDLLDVPLSLVYPDSTADSLGADSLDMVECIMALEDAFNLDLPDELLSENMTVLDVTKIIARQLDRLSPVTPVVEAAKPSPAQEYDANGRPLSMTANAIRKRSARAAATAAKATQRASVTTSLPKAFAPKNASVATWPMPAKKR